MPNEDGYSFDVREWKITELDERFQCDHIL
jgi:hypothetical protein